MHDVVDFSSCRKVFLAKKLFSYVMFAGFFVIHGHTAIAEQERAEPTISKEMGSTHQQLFLDAINDDLSGRNKEARSIYDRLKISEMATVSAVPSAINYAALGQYDDAMKAFRMLSSSANARERDYARLWQLWLTAKQWKGTRAELTHNLKKQAVNYKWQLPYQQEIAQLYIGKGSEDSVFQSIENWNVEEAVKKDALTEATFFVGGYLQHVKQDIDRTRALFNANQSKLNSVSLERPFIDRECIALNKLTHQSK
ncbi:hypothetical protein [Leminorella grimontii]|uniref:hypothetical protein n=1 Tax=Leminorella grimontii TaxID=82981 RepID=UPI0032201330